MIQKPSYASHCYENFHRDGYCNRNGPDFGRSIFIHQFECNNNIKTKCHVNCTYGEYGCKDSSLFVGKPGLSGEIPFTIKNLEVFTFI